MIGTMAAIGLGLGAVGSVVSSSAKNKAAGQAADASLQVAEKNNALTREMYAKNEANLTPFMNTGNAAMGQVNALLGMGGTAATVGNADYGSYLQANPDVLNDYNANVDKTLFPTAEAYAKWHYQNYGMGEHRALPSTGGTPGVSAQQAAENAFGQYQNSTGYKFRLGEGMNALNSGYAGAGTIQSGAAMKGAIKYGQNFASNEFGNYMGQLGNQQALGMQGASALAGVGQNAVNNMTANNNAAGTAQANALLSQGANNPLGGALGMIGGGLWSFGK